MLDDSTALATSGAQLFPLLRSHGVEPFEYRGQPAFLPKQVAAALGYPNATRMLSWLAGRPETVKGTHRAVITAGELSQAKAIVGTDLAANSRSWRETILFLPGLVFILDETRIGAGSPLRLAYRAWRDVFFAAAFSRATQPAAPIPEAPKQIAGPPAQVMLTLAREGTHPGDVFATSYLVAELARSRAKDRADREAQKAADRAAIHADKVTMSRLREAERLACRAKKAPPSTLW